MNHKVDDYGNIYIFITRKEMGEYLKSSSKTVIKVFKISRDTEGMSKMDLYDFYNIGDIYRDEHRNE